MKTLRYIKTLPKRLWYAVGLGVTLFAMASYYALVVDKNEEIEKSSWAFWND